MRGNDRQPGGRRQHSSAHPLARGAHPLARAAGRPVPAAPVVEPPAAEATGAAGAAAPAAPRGPRLDGEGRPYITLAQFLKHHDLAPTGGAAKHLARAGGVTVNGVAEDRPGRKLHAGDRVALAGRELTVALT